MSNTQLLQQLLPFNNEPDPRRLASLVFLGLMSNTQLLHQLLPFNNEPDPRRLASLVFLELMSNTQLPHQPLPLNHNLRSSLQTRVRQPTHASQETTSRRQNGCSSASSLCCPDPVLHKHTIRFIRMDLLPNLGLTSGGSVCIQAWTSSTLDLDHS